MIAALLTSVSSAGNCAITLSCSMGGNLCGVSTGEALSRWCAVVVGNNALADFERRRHQSSVARPRSASPAPEYMTAARERGPPRLGASDPSSPAASPCDRQPVPRSWRRLLLVPIAPGVERKSPTTG